MTTETVLIFPEIMREWEGTDNALSFARAIEQAVLQSPEIQALRKDAARMRNALNKIAAMDSMSYHSLESAKITARAALEQQT